MKGSPALEFSKSVQAKRRTEDMEICMKHLLYERVPIDVRQRFPAAKGTFGISDVGQGESLPSLYQRRT